MFFCTSCGNESLKWLGKCPACNAWNSFKEAPIQPKPKKGKKDLIENLIDEEKTTTSHLYKIGDIITQEAPRIQTLDTELNRVLGGGIVRGSIILVAGEPGIGKSTLFLQTALSLPKGTRTLYVSGEESAQQIKLRADRLANHNGDVHILTDIATNVIFSELQTLRPDCVIIDSIQTLHSPYVDAMAGSILQIRECTAELQRYAKKTHTPIFIIGHINKEGSIAGPKLLEHMVDAVIQFEGEREHNFRILRTLKNRFGANTEIGVYEMKSDGLHIVDNPSNIFLSAHQTDYHGTAVGAIIEGQRPILLEVQALVTNSAYGTPQRTVKGFDLRKLQLLLAVLEKHGGFHFGAKDVFVNIVGGLRADEPSLDLAVISALLSSFEEKPLPPKTCFLGEVGLSGELRAINKIEQCIIEVARLGFMHAIIPTTNYQHITQPNIDITLHSFSKVEEVYRWAL